MFHFLSTKKCFFWRDQHNLLSHPAEGEGSSAIGKVGGKESAIPCDCTLSIQWYWRIVRLFAIVDFKSKILGKLTMPLVFALMINALNLLTSFPNLQVADRQQPQAYPGTLDDLKFVWFTRHLRVLHLLQCTMLPLSTRSCLKSSKLGPILNGQFCHAISKNIGLNLFGSKQPREILVFVILKL